MAAVHAPPETWHTRLTTRLADVQRAVAGLRAVCEEPAARQTLEASQRGYAAAAVAPLLAEADLRTADAIGDLQSVRSALAWRAPPLKKSRRCAVSFAALPQSVALHIFAMLPSDARARAALVCREWRAAERSLWTRLMLSPASDVPHPWRVTDATLRAAAARAPGQLMTLVLENCSAVTQHARLEVVTANAGSLRELRCVGPSYEDHLSAADVEALARAAPQLQVFTVDLSAPAADATRLLRNDAPFQALRVRDLLILETHVVDEEVDVLALAAAMATHASLERALLTACRLDTPALLDAVCASARVRRLRTLRLERCGLSPASVPALARLIRDGSLKCIFMNNGDDQLLDAPAAVQLADVIATNRQLQELQLCAVDLWRVAAAAATVLQALVGHSTLDEIDVSGNERCSDQIAAGAALGALVAANAPALKTLCVESSFLGDAGLGPLVDALPHNTHLRDLICYKTGMSEAFARDRFLPAVQANTSLRELEASRWWNNQEEGRAPPAVLQAEALVAARNVR